MGSAWRLRVERLTERGWVVLRQLASTDEARAMANNTAVRSLCHPAITATAEGRTAAESWAAVVQGAVPRDCRLLSIGEICRAVRWRGRRVRCILNVMLHAGVNGRSNFDVRSF